MDGSKVFFSTRIDGITFSADIWNDGPYIKRISSQNGLIAPLGPRIWIERVCISKGRPAEYEWVIMLGKNKRIPLSGLSETGIESLSTKFALPIKSAWTDPESERLKRFWWDRFWTTDVFDGLCEWVCSHRGDVRKIVIQAQKDGNGDLPWWLYYSRWEKGPLNMRLSIAKEGITPEALRSRMAEDKSRAVRCVVAETSRNNSILCALSKDKSPLVRRAVAGNRLVSIGELSGVLVQDKNAAVREQAKATLRLACKR